MCNSWQGTESLNPCIVVCNYPNTWECYLAFNLPNLFLISILTKLNTAFVPDLTVMFITTEAVVQRCSLKKMFLEISQNSQENTCTRVSFLIKFSFLIILWKERLWQICFPVNFAKSLRTHFLQNTSGRLFLY